MVDLLTIGVIVVGALSAASYYQQRKMQRQAEKQANEMASHQISGHDSNRALYTVYGRALIGTTTIYKRVSRRNIPMANANFTNFVGGGGSPSTESKTYGLNRFLYRISSLSNGPINGIENVLIDGEKYTANRFTAGHRKHFEAAVSLGPTAGNHFANLRTSYATDFSAWGADKKGQGVAYVVERFWFDKSNPAYQGEPSTQYLVKGRSLYDPRLDSTVSGGSGSHRSDTPSTWAFSDNPALALLDMLTNDEYGRGVSHADCNMATFIAAANKCDTLVDIPARATNTTGATMVVYDPHTGTTHEIPDNGTISNYRIDQQTTGPNANKQKRFRLNMAVDNSKEVLDNIQQILQSFRGNLHHINGEYVVHMDDVASPVLTLTDDDIIGGLKIAQGDRKQRINRMTAKFLNANKHYKTDQVSWPPIDSDSSSQYQTYLTADSGEKLHKTVTLTGCTDYYQAEDIAEYLVRESRVTLAVSGTFGSRCFNLVPGDVIALDYDSAGYSGKYFIVDQVGVDVAAMNVKLSLREYDSSVYTWNTARGNEPVALYFDEEQQYNATPTSLTLGTVSSAVITLADGTATVSLVVNYSGVPEEATAVEIGWAPTGTSDYTTNVMQEDATKTKFQLGIDNQDIDIRVRYIVTNADGLQLPSGYASTTFTLPAVSGTRLGGMDDNATRNTGVLADRDTVDTIHIEADAVTAAKIDVTNLSAINADLGAITAGTLQADTATKIPDANDSPSGSETGAFIDLNNGKFVFGDANKHLLYDGSTLLVKGELEADILDVIDATITGQLTANAISAGAVTVASLSAGVFAEFDDRYGTSGGFYVTDTDEFFDGNSTKYVTVGTVAHSTDDIYFECRLNHSWSWPRNDTGNKLNANVSFEYSTDNSTWTTVPSSTTQVATATGVVAQYATLFSIAEDITYTMTGSALTAGNYYFRVKIVAQNSTNAFQLAAFGGGSGVPIAFEVQESSGISAAGGNADTLDGLDSTQFLRSDTNDTFSGDLTITGQLILNGSIDQYNVTDLNVTDKTITVNSGNTQTLSDGAGLIVDRGTAANASITWDETNDKFDFTNPISVSGIISGGFDVANFYSGSTQAHLNIGRSSAERFNFYVTDGPGFIRYYQDETDGTDHSFHFEIQSSSTGTNQFYFNKQINVTNQGNSSQWNTAYGWGDHSTQGYLTAEADTLATVTGRGATTTNAISTGAITSSGIVSGTAFVGGLYAGATGAPDARIWAVSADYPNYGIFYDEGNPDYIDFRWNGVDKLKINMENGLVNSVTGFQVNGTDVINSSRNLVNIGTISSGEINASSTIKAETAFGGFITLKRADTTTTNNTDIGVINFEHTDTDDAGVAATILVSGDGDAGGAKMRFYTGTPTSRAERLAIDKDGTVNIVTSGLDFAGTTVIASTRRLYASSGTSVKAAYSFDGDSGTGISRTAAGRIDFLSSGAVKAYIKTGTSNPISPTMYVDGRTEINGVVTWTGGSSTNANTAYGWGDHSAAGYMTGGTNFANDRLITASGSNSLNGEANLTFNGTSLSMAGQLLSTYIGGNGGTGSSQYGIHTESTSAGQATMGAHNTGDGYANLNLSSVYNSDRKMWHISKRPHSNNDRLEFFWYESGGFNSRYIFATSGDFTAHNNITANGSFITATASTAQGIYAGSTQVFEGSTRNLKNIGTISSGDITTTGTVLINDSLGANSTSAMGNFDRLEFSNSFSDVMRGPNKILMYNSGGWVGGFGIADDLVTYSSGGSHVFYSSQNTTTYDERFRIDDSGDITVNRMIIARSDSGVSAPSNADHTLGTRIKFFDGGSAEWYAQGIESSNMWFNTAGGFKWYNDSNIQMTLSADRLGIATTPHASDKLRVGGSISQSAGSIFAFGDLVIGQGALKQGTTTLIDASRNLTNIVNSTSTGLISNIRTSAFSPNDSSAGLRLEYSGGHTAGDIGSGIVFAQRWYSGSTDNIRTGGIAGFKGGGNGVYGGGLKFYTQPQSGADMNVVLTLDRTQNATFANNVAVGNDLIINGTTRINSAGNATLGTTTTGALTAGAITATSLSLSGAFTPTSIAATSTVSGSQFRSSYGSVSAPAFTFKNDDDTGMWGASGSVKFAVNGSNRMTIGASATTVSGRISVVGDLQAGSVPQTIITTGRAIQNVTTVTTSSTIYSGGTLTVNGNNLIVSGGGAGDGKLYFSGHGGASNYNYFLKADNDTGRKAVMFVNGSTRSGDGGPNTFTIRNDGGSLRLGNTGYSTLLEGSLISFNGTTILSSSRNLVNIGTISSGAITSSGNSIITGSGSTGNALTVVRGDNGTTQALRVQNTGQVIVSGNYLYASHTGTSFYSQGTSVFRGTITNDGGNNLSISSGGSDITFNSKNFTSVGTISSGAITSTGNMSLTGSLDITKSGSTHSLVLANRDDFADSSNDSLIWITSGVGTFKNGQGAHLVFEGRKSTRNFYFKVGNVTAPQHIMHYNGFVGFGTGDVTPTDRVQVSGTVRADSYKVGTTTVIDSSRVVQNVTLQHGTSGSRFQADGWFYDTGTQRARLYFENNGRTFFGSGNGYNFRDSADTTRFTISNYGGLNLMSGGEGHVASNVALAVGGTTTIDSSRNVFGVNGSFTGYAAIGSRIGTINPSLSVVGATNSSPFLAKSGSYSTVFSVLPWSDAITYLASGTYYQGGSWVHASPNNYECLLGISGDAGAKWYVTSNGVGGSWNHANNVQLWNNSGVWTSNVDTSGTVTAGSGSSSTGYYVGTTQIVQGSTRNLVNIGTITAGLTKLTPSGWTSPQGHAALNIGYNGSGETRGIDIRGLWSVGESKSITFSHGSLASHIVGQINVAHKPTTNTGGSSIRWGKLYHGGDSSTYTMELHSESQTLANLYINTSMVQIGHDATYSNYGVIGFGGRANGNNRVFAHNGTSDGLFLASATGHGIYMRPNGTDVTKLTVASSGQVEIAQGDITLGQDGTYGSNYGTVGFGGTSNGSNRIFARNNASDGLYLAAATGAKIKVRANGSASDTLVFGYDDSYTSYASLGFGGALQNGYNRIFASTGNSDGMYINAATGRGIFFRVNGNGNNVFQIKSDGGLYVGASAGTLVLDQSRNLTNIGTISSGAITINSGTANTSLATSSSDAANWMTMTDPSGTIFFGNSGANYELWVGSAKQLEVTSSASNFTGTISSGAITATNGNVTITTGYNLQWGSGYSGGHPSISATSNAMFFYPTGNVSGANFRLYASMAEIRDGNALRFQRAGNSAYGELTYDSGENITLYSSWGGKYLRFTRDGHLQLSGTTVIDSSRNLTNIAKYNVSSSSYFVGNTNYGYRFNNAADTLNLVILDDSGNLDVIHGNVEIGGSTVIDSVRRFYASSGTSVKAAFSFDGDSTTGMYRPAASQVAFIAGATDALYMDNNRHVVIGGNFTNNPYNAVSSTRLMFGSGNSDADSNYYIGTNLENYGGNYTKLDLRWHTGIRMGAQSVYGGIRMYNNEDLTTLLFSVGKSGTSTAVESGNFRVVSGAIQMNTTTVIDASRNGVFVSLRADGGNLIMGDEAYSASAGYVGMKTSLMSGSNDYMILSGISDPDTYVSAKDGASVNIRGGGNSQSNQLTVPDSSYITATTSNFYCTGNVTAYYSSDKSLKENIRVIDSPIEKIKQIRGVYFDWTDDYIKEQSGDGEIYVRKDDVGVIAQDVQPVLDEVVTTRDDGTLAVRYEKMIALCIEAIKEQQDQIDSLKSIIEEMKNGDN